MLSKECAMYPDFEALLSALNEHKVKYLVVGGYAVSKYAQPRATKDLDIFIAATSSNAVRLFNALKSFGAPTGHYAASDLIRKGSFFRMGIPPVAIDILPEIDGVLFADAWRDRVIATVNPKTDLRAYFISLDDLITGKLAAGRSRDLADVEELRAATDGTAEPKHRASNRRTKAVRPAKGRPRS
jgi:hypothetical protein